MEQQLLVLLYSKYSQNSKRFMDMLNEAQVDIRSAIGLTSLCIDNEEIRKHIIKSQKIEINVVPSILIVYKDGGVEKYEGDTAFQWAEEIIFKLSPPPPPSPPPHSPIQSRHKLKPIQPRHKLKPIHPVPKQTPPPPTQQHMEGSTSIDDLDSEDDSGEPEVENYEEEEDDDEITANRPPVPIRSGAGNYEVQGEFGVLEEPNRNVTRGIKSTSDSAVNGNKKNLMDAAMAMQKLREQEDSSRKPVGIPTNR